MKNSLRGMIVLALLMIVFSAAAFVIPFARTAAFWIAYGFGVLALLFQLYVFKAAFSKDGSARSRFYGFPIARVGVIYLAVQLIVSFIEMALAKLLPVWVPLIVNLVLFAAAAIGCITVETMRDEIVRQDGQLKKDVSNMRELQSLSASLANQCADESLKPTLRKLADEFRFSDPVSSENTSELEADMRSRLGDIQQALIEGDAVGVKNLCARLTGTLTERNRICALNK